jgi:two-component system chemotaxis response regulator CheB
MSGGLATVINLNGIPRDVIVIGASAGGVSALTELLAKLRPTLPAAVAVVLHRSRVHAVKLQAVLGRRAQISVVEPMNGERFERGVVYVAPRDRHMLIGDDRIELSRGPAEHRCRPAADPLFRSAAQHYGPRVVGAVLSGFGFDGSAGLIAITKAGGMSLAQQPAEAGVPDMPYNAIRHDRVDAVLPLDTLSSTLQALAMGEAVVLG